MEEIWKGITGFSNYEISNLGNVRSVDRKIKKKNNLIRIIKGKLLKKLLSWDKNYYSIGMYDDLGKYCKRLIHRLVAETFISNPNGFEIVNHKDENKFNNSVSNLEWVTVKQNCLYSYYKHPERNKNSVSILLYDLTGVFIKKWDSIKQAAEFYNISLSNISECLVGNSKSSNKYLWKYYYNDNFPRKIDGYSKNSKYRKIILYDLFGNYIRVWNSMIDIKNTLNINIHGINNCCKGILNSSGKFIWRFYLDDFPIKIKTKFKRILQYDLNGNLLNIFNSAYDAAVSINKSNNQGIITGCCKGNRKTAYGYIWKYEK